jgi:D-inositol-3-phosphate glycosyltransferase
MNLKSDQAVFSGAQKKSTNNLGILCSSFSLGGLEINVVKLAAWMSQRGTQVILYVPKGSPMSALALKYRVRTHPIPKAKKYFDIKGAINLCKQTKADNIKILLISSGKDISLCGWAKFFSLNRLKLIFLQQMMIGIKKRDIIHTLRYSKLDAWLSPLPYLAKELKEKTRIPDHKVHLVPLCIETERFSRQRLTKEDARRTLALPQDKTIIGIIGRLDFQKGQHILIEAFSKLKENPDTELLIMGEETKGENNQYLERLIKLAQHLQLTEKIHFRPFHNEVQIAYAAIDIFIMASPGETYGMVTIEAMASGLPVIGADAGGTSELLDHGQLGLLFKPGDAEDLAVKIKWALDNPRELEKISRAGHRHVLKSYSHNRGCELIEAVINQLIINN